MHTLQFWSLATLMVLATTAMLVVPLYWRDARLPSGGAWRRWEPLLIAAAVPLVALAFYSRTGSPALITGTSTADDDAITRLHAGAMRGERDGGDLDAAIARLRARLAEHPDDAAGWKLLEQAYEFQGRGNEASGALAQRAEDARRNRDFSAAVAAFAELERQGTLTADQWADYADALGGAHGGLDEDAARCIDAALRLDPTHVKALWLRASLQTQRRDYDAALTTWQRLAKLLPPDSPDARIIAANLEEARGRLQEAGGAPAPSAIPSTILRGSVSLDPRWQSRVSAGSVLFIYARAADERGPPLAVRRTMAGSWPVRFELADADAMMPGRRLSDFHRVVLEARLSSSGDALPQPGDLRATSGVLDPRNAGEQRLVIAELVGGTAGTQGS